MQVIEILEKTHSWTVYNPIHLVKEAINNSPQAVLYGKGGLIRTTCLEFVSKADIIIAYTGLIWDTGTAREVEFALMKEKPIIAWSDSSVIFGETFEEENDTLDGFEPDRLKTRAIPFNAMDIVFDKYIRLNKLYSKEIGKNGATDKLLDYCLDEKQLADIINKEAKETLARRSTKK
jgi:nucleoside 2-deoxyribosyltransferase